MLYLSQSCMKYEIMAPSRKSHVLLEPEVLNKWLERVGKIRIVSTIIAAP